MSALTPYQMKQLAAAEKQAELMRQNKEAARVHLLAIKSYLTRSIPIPKN